MYPRHKDQLQWPSEVQTLERERIEKQEGVNDGMKGMESICSLIPSVQNAVSKCDLVVEFTNSPEKTKKQSRFKASKEDTFTSYKYPEVAVWFSWKCQTKAELLHLVDVTEERNIASYGDGSKKYPGHLQNMGACVAK